MTAAEPDSFARALALVSPRDAEAAYQASLQAVRLGYEAEGLRVLEAARRCTPNDPRLWQMSGLLHRKMDELQPAISAFLRAAQLAPKDPLILHSLARVHLEGGQPSVELFRKARALRPNDGDLLLGLAAALLAEGDAEAAIQELDAALLQHPGWLPGHDALSKLRWQNGRPGELTASLERALAAHPRDLSLWRALMIMLTQGDLYDEALAAISRGRALAGDDDLFDANEAVCRAELGEFEEADRLFARVSHLDDVTVRLRQTRHLLRTGRVTEAGQLAEPMAASEAAHMFWPYLALIWRMAGDPRWEWLEGDPRLVQTYDLSGELSLQALADRLRSLHLAKDQPLEQSVRGGTQTDGALFSRVEPEIQALRKTVVEAVERYVGQLPPPDPHHPLLSKPRSGRVRFAGSWSVRLRAKGHHANHVHPAGWLSSAFYVAVPTEEECGGSRGGWLALGEPQAQLGLDLSPTRLIEPKPGHLVLFPSTMWHGTRPFDAGERLTVAFDVAPLA